ncbi:MAG: hypothetical protein F4X16_08935 [Caldilineaceae bacterium SB0661_bin_34]|nr:hypothetical protein [Caldilineaceae bacterium SB0661_bin_34]
MQSPWISRAIAGQYTRPAVLRQTAGDFHGPSAGAAAVATRTRPHRPQDLRWPAARTYARWFGRPFPFARLAVSTLAVVHPQVSKGLGPLLAAVDVEEGGAYPLCARQSPAAGRARRKEPARRDGRGGGAGPAAGGPGGRGRGHCWARWVAVDEGYASRTFVKGVRVLGLHTVGRLRRDTILRYRYTGPHPRRPGRRQQFDGRFDPCDPTRLTRTTLDDEQVDLYHGELPGAVAGQAGLPPCGVRGPLLSSLAGPAPSGRAPGPLFPAPNQAAQPRDRDPQTLCRPLGPGPTRRQLRGAAQPPAPSGNRAYKALNTALPSTPHNISDLKMCPNHRLAYNNVNQNSPGRCRGCSACSSSEGFRSNGHGYMASEPPSPSGHGPEPLRVSAMSNFTNTGFVQVRIVASLLVRFPGLVQLVVEIGRHLLLVSPIGIPRGCRKD